ncbi:MAG: 30S ribosomal protein S2 [Coriobacteriales bacterium]|nr:30S ribosomal protein S2 [Coriobacteriales bacterium]
MAATVSIKSLLEAGVHFGHQTRRWNPKMKPYIFGERNGIYILDLKQTMYALDDAYSFLSVLGASGKKVLFVGTKKQAQEPVKANAERAGMPYVNYRWMGGMLTNFATIRTRVQRMEEIEAMKANGTFEKYTKKEQAVMNKELDKLQMALGGIRDMHDLPDALFVVDTKHEENAVREAHRLHIPIIGLIDTNADPDEIDFGIPANDDAIRSVNLLCSVAADALVAGAGAEVTEEEMAAEAPAEEATEAAETTEEAAE